MNSSATLARLLALLLMTTPGANPAAAEAVTVYNSGLADIDIVDLGAFGLQLITIRSFTRFSNGSASVYLDNSTVLAGKPESAYVNHFRDQPAERTLLWLPLLGIPLADDLVTGRLTGAQITCPTGSGDKPRIMTAYSDAAGQAGEPFLVDIGGALHLDVLIADAVANEFRANDSSTSANLIGPGTLTHPSGC